MKYAIAFVLCYLFFAFILWEVNPSNWSEQARVGCVMSFFTLMLLIELKPK